MKSYSARLRIAKNRLWKKISEYVRRKYADHNGFVRCYTCSVAKHWKEMDAGHFVPQGSCSALQFDYIRNIRPQETGCNRFKGGNPIVFRSRLCEEIGEAEVKIMEQVYFSHQAKKWNLSEIEALEAQIERDLEWLEHKDGVL